MALGPECIPFDGNVINVCWIEIGVLAWLEFVFAGLAETSADRFSPWRFFFWTTRNGKVKTHNDMRMHRE